MDDKAGRTTGFFFEHLNRRDDVDNPSDALSFFAKFASVFPRMLSFGGKMLDFPIILTFS